MELAGDRLVAEDAVERGAGDAELACGAEFVSAVEVENIFDVASDDGIEVERGGGGRGAGRGGIGRCLRLREDEVICLDDAVGRFEECGFKDAGELADVSGPVMLEEAGKCAGTEGEGSLLVAAAEPVKERLGEERDFFSTLAQGWDGETDGGEAVGEVGDQEPLGDELPQGSLGSCDEGGAAGGQVLECFEDGEQEALAGSGEQVDAVEVVEAGGHCGAGNVDEPLASVVALKGGVGEWGTAVKIAGERLLS